MEDAIDSRGDGAFGNPQCRGEPVDRLTFRRGARPGGSPVWVSLYLYGDEATASTVFTEVEARGLSACLGYPGAQLAPEPWRSFGTQSVAVTFLQPSDGAGELAGMSHRAVMVRVGRVVEVFDAGPSTGYAGAVEAASLEALELIIEVSLRRLCLYADAGCVRPAGLPEPLAELTQGGSAWLVLIELVSSVDPEPGDGLAIAYAARAGYHPSIVRVGCDLSLKIHWDAEWEDAYVALYFADRIDAEVAKNSLPTARTAGLVPSVHSVTTRCVR